MGCDIHAHLEIKWNGGWIYYAPLRISRNYDLFSFLADVRNVQPGTDGYIKPLSDPRGLPKDVTLMTQIHSDVDGEDGHSHSWISAKEYVKAQRKFKFNGDEAKAWYEKVYLFGNSFHEFFNYRADYPKGVTNFRMVFWFDN